MYIRRDRSNLHFGSQVRRGVSRLNLILLLVVVAGAGLVIWQFDAIQGQVAAMFGEPPTPTQSAPAQARQGYTAYLNGNLDAAVAAYAEAVRLDPQNVDYLYEYGHALLLLNRGEEGLDIAERVITADRTDPRGPPLKVGALYQLDRLDEAISVGLAALELGENFAPLYAALVWPYADIGRWNQALDMGEQAVALDPNLMDAYRAYAYALTWVGAREQAAQALEAAIALQPALDFLYFEVAEKYRALDNVQAAIAAYERVLAIKPANTRAMLRLCETYFNLREDVRAEEYCRQALDIDATYADAWRQIGLVYYMQSRYQDAVDAFERCVANGADSIYCYYVRGLAYYYLHRCDLAVPLLQESLERTQSDRILGFIREGLRLCQSPVEEPTATPPPEGEG
jgi:superkiller protein 3